MGVIVASGTAVSVAANTKSSNQVSGTYEFLPWPAMIRVIARGSATGMLVQLVSDGQNLVSDMAIPYTGTAGAISTNDHVIAEFPVPQGSRTEFYLRNGTVGALTTDFIIDAEPILEE